MTTSYKFHREYQIHSDHYALWVVRFEDGFSGAPQRLLFAPPTLVQTQPGLHHAKPPEPFLTGNDGEKQFLQAAMDMAYEIGLTPTNSHSHEPEVAAIRAHLNDMRAIVGKQLKTQLP